MVAVGVNSDLEEGDTGSGSFPECPRCGSEIVATTVIGPSEGTASPCGCRVIPPVLEFE
ncbi:hypothetical protein C496_17997 [Natronorubrum tibetense GA33]|uniref:Small CPxCG-related zinc finger protein n=1 Tax=Natronorubrum tibetense GA33 TaxID=1114856 RepID=L9VMW6_9EURY|nr:hypothetical protein C496_17997 [Natronorubrum tibetense GA33]